MSAAVVIVAGPETLWQSYLAASAMADTAILDWGETVIAGGRGWQAGAASVTMYEALEAQRRAYVTYVDARNARLRQGI